MTRESFKKCMKSLAHFIKPIREYVSVGKCLKQSNLKHTNFVLMMDLKMNKEKKMQNNLSHQTLNLGK